MVFPQKYISVFHSESCQASMFFGVLLLNQGTNFLNMVFPLNELCIESKGHVIKSR